MVPRQTLSFTGQPYSIQHFDAYPRPAGASSGLQAEGGRITGNICGVSVEYSVEHAGDRVKMSGLLESEYQAHLEIVDTDGYKTISGSMAYREANWDCLGFIPPLPHRTCDHIIRAGNPLDHAHGANCAALVDADLVRASHDVTDVTRLDRLGKVRVVPNTQLVLFLDCTATLQPFSAK
jgi:hypothetical protein